MEQPHPGPKHRAVKRLLLILAHLLPFAFLAYVLATKAPQLFGG